MIEVVCDKFKKDRRVDSDIPSKAVPAITLDAPLQGFWTDGKCSWKDGRTMMERGAEKDKAGVNSLWVVRKGSLVTDQQQRRIVEAAPESASGSSTNPHVTQRNRNSFLFQHGIKTFIHFRNNRKIWQGPLRSAGKQKLIGLSLCCTKLVQGLFLDNRWCFSPEYRLFARLLVYVVSIVPEYPTTGRGPGLFPTDQ